MKPTIPAFIRTTTFRLAVVHAVMFAIFTLGLLVYLYHSTAGYMRNESVRELDAELQAIGAAFRSGGMERLNQTIRRPQDLNARLGITPFATIPYLPTPAEAGLGRLRSAATWIAILGGIPAALYAVHAFYLPLDLLAARLSQGTGLAALLPRSGP